jgi:hypothetical protein
MEHQAVEAAADRSAAQTFEVLWSALHDVMGSAATATLMRRAALQAVHAAPELDGFDVTRERFEYRYVLPASWSIAAPVAPPRSLDVLMRALRPLLVELTGPVMLKRLDGIPELRARGHFSPEVAP